LKIKTNIFSTISLTLILVPVLIAGMLTGCASTPPATTAETTQSTSTFMTPTPTFASGPIFTPKATPFNPSQELKELMQYTLELINLDRQAAGVNPVTLNFNAAAQIHAKDMFDQYYWAHWGTDGLKPYMRYTNEGGLGYEKENAAYTGTLDPGEDKILLASINVKNEIKALENQMINNDAKANWGHRDNILYKWHQKVNIGLAYDKNRIALVQQFEGNYVDYIQPPTLSGNTLSLSGRTRIGVLNNVTVCYDATPKPLTPHELISGPYHSYDLGNRIGYIVMPPPPGQYYSSLGAEAIQAEKWDSNQSGQFSIQTDISKFLATGKGVYTIVLVSKVNEELVNLSNYTILVN
jgi:uncharacterized protein YkwD